LEILEITLQFRNTSTLLIDDSVVLFASRFHPLLKSLGNVGDTKATEEAQVCILRSLFELWKNHQQVYLSGLFFGVLRKKIVKALSDKVAF